MLTSLSIHIPEAVAWRLSLERVFLKKCKINKMTSTMTSFFNKVTGQAMSATFLIKDTIVGVFHSILSSFSVVIHDITLHKK